MADDPRVVMITGGSRGIGAACAAWFAERGDRVAVTSRAGGVPAPEGVPADRWMSIACDVTDAGQVEAAFTAVEEAWGPVEVLVANAGITKDTLVLRMDDASWYEVLETNLTGVFRFAKRAIAKMLRQRSGRIVIISSIGAFMGSPGQANYAAAKAGLVGMARSMAREVASRSITVNVVAPGLVETDMLAEVAEDRREQLVSAVPLGRAGRPEEIAAAVGYLASPEAGYVTGAVLAVDGGVAMGL